MKRRRLLLVLLGCVVVGIVAFLIWPRQREPMYKGKTLTEWIVIHEKASGLNSVHGSRYDPVALRESFDAVNQIGTNSLPWLIKWLSLGLKTSSSRWRHHVATALEKVSGELEDNSIADEWLQDPDWVHFSAATVGFQILGTNASPAVPELTRLAREQPRMSTSIFYVLSNIGPDGVPPLLTAISDPQNPGRKEAIHMIRYCRHLGTNEDVVVQLLYECLDEVDSKLAANAAESLGSSWLNTEHSVPLLVSGLQNPMAQVRRLSAGSLSLIGSEAQPALPALTVVLNDPDRAVRMSATNAIERITEDILRGTNTTVQPSKREFETLRE